LIGSIATTGFDDPFNKDGDGGKYKKILNEEFNLIGAENEFKPYGWSGTKNPNSRDAKDAIVDTSNADKIAEFVRSHN
jgi:GH35 family endo-1,4-beta-xylanase